MKPKITREIRYDADNFVDEFIICVDGKCIFHLEHMGQSGDIKGQEKVWMGLYTDEGEVHINLIDIQGFQMYDSSNLIENAAFPEVFIKYKDRKLTGSY